MRSLHLVPALALCGAILSGMGSEAAAAPAQATWTPAQCGREPAPPPVDTTSVERYNASVDRVTLYERSARAYNTCVARAANTQQAEISNEARDRINAIQSVSIGVQRRISANFAALGSSLRRNPPRPR